MLMVISTRDNGLTIKLTEKEHILMPTELITQAIGSKTNKKELAWNHGPMELNTLVNTKMVKRMEEAS